MTLFKLNIGQNILRLMKRTSGLFKIGTLCHFLDIICLFYAFNKKNLKQTNDKQTNKKQDK